jgi:peptidylprolyl isomerase|tara:strand:+ start:603 stop:1211 length:609 start_codon:yes stop_codon:yes gene_type:complete
MGILPAMNNRKIKTQSFSGLLIRLIMSLVLTTFAIGVNMNSAASNTDIDENTLVMELKDGTVIINMLPELAPNHVARIKELVRSGFYDGLLFHRVIDGFMAQTGDPRGDGTGGSGKNLDAEFSDEPHVRGVLSMARAQDPNSADSQFFIVFEDSSWLDGQYTVWGRVKEGIEFVDLIKRGDGQNGQVNNPDKIISMKILSDE